MLNIFRVSRQYFARLAALVQAHAVRHGARLTDKGLTLALDAVKSSAARDIGANGAGDGAGTMLRLATIQALAEATSPEVIGIPSSTTRTTVPTTPPATGKAMTRAQRIAFAKKSHALAESVAAAHAPTLELGPVDTSTLSEATLTMCAAYRPTGAVRAQVWEANLLLAQRLLLGTRPPSARVASSYGSAVARFLAWFAAWPGRGGAGTGALITVEELLASGVVESFVRLEGLGARSASTYRSVIRRAVDSLDPAPRRTKLAYRPGAAPYQPGDIDQFMFLAANQRTPGQRAALCTAIALGAGAGLDTSDLRGITPAHIQATPLPDGTRRDDGDRPGQPTPHRPAPCRLHRPAAGGTGGPHRPRQGRKRPAPGPQTRPGQHHAPTDLQGADRGRRSPSRCTSPGCGTPGCSPRCAPPSRWPS